jgi:hypothetical protein
VPPWNSTAARREESPISKHQPLRVPHGYHRRGSGATVGDNHRGPLITRENPSIQKIINTNERSSNPTKHAPCCRSPKKEGPQPKETITAHQPTGHHTPRVILCLARGADAPLGGSPPRFRPPRARGLHTHSPDQSIKCSGMPRAPGSKANPHHAGPLTPPGNHIPALFRQPSL